MIFDNIKPLALFLESQCLKPQFESRKIVSNALLAYLDNNYPFDTAHIDFQDTIKPDFVL